jgi:hypothetical protein
MPALTDKQALAWLVQRGRFETSAAELARAWSWHSTKVKRYLDRWSSEGHIEVKSGLGGRTMITALPPSGSNVASAVSTQTVSVPAVNAVPTMVSVASPAASAPAPDNEAPEVVEGTASTESAPAVSEAPAVVAGPSQGATPDGAASPEPPTQEAATLPARADAAPEPAVLRAPVATVLPPAPPVSAAAVSATPIQAPLHLHPRGSGFVNALAYVVAVALAAIAAFFSITGMIVLFPGAPTAIVTMGVIMEAAKLVTVAFLAHQWRTLAWLSRLVLIILVTGLAAINAAGVYSQLVAAHFGDRVTATSAVETEAATLAARTEVQAQTVADIDRRVTQIDSAVAEMTKRGRASGALDAIAAQRKQRDALVGQRRQEADKLAALKSDAAAVAARNHRIEVEAAPIMYVAQMMGASTEQAIRMLILLMVLTCDPLAVALTAAASRPRWRRP